MDIVKLNSKSPIETFTSNFHYAWNNEKEKPQVMVEHYSVNWSIESLSLLLLEEHKLVSSPTFVLDSSKTAWYIEVYPNGLCNSAQSIDILLYRSLDSGPSSVGLTFRFGVLQTDGETIWLKENEVENFRKKTFEEISVQDPERSVLSENKFEYSKVFTITCEMYVTYTFPQYDENLLQPADYDLINFSFDFSKLLRAIEITDFFLKVPGLNIKTHKSILAARSATIREILRREDFNDEVRFDDISSDNVVRVLHFMYTGNLTTALKGKLPSIGFFECAQKLAVRDLIALLSPKHLHLRSILKSQEFNFTWSVRNFTKRCKTGKTSIRSAAFSGPFENAPKWYLIVNFDQVSDKLSVFVETSGETKAVHSILKISLLDGNGEVINTRITTRFRKPNLKFGFPEFLKDFSNHNLMFDLLINDTLRIHCELIFVVSYGMHEVHDTTVNEPTSFLDFYRNLSDEVNELFETSAFSDITVKAKDNTILKVHKSILFARSRKFYSKFLYYNKGERILEIYDVDPDLLLIMLKHAYSGILNPMTTGDMLRLHKAADLYVFRQLALITLHHLASQINVRNCFELLVAGNKLEDRYLEEKCLLFMRENSKTIMAITDWDKCRSENKIICDFVVEYLQQETLR